MKNGALKPYLEKNATTFSKRNGELAAYLLFVQISIWNRSGELLQAIAKCELDFIHPRKTRTDESAMKISVDWNCPVLTGSLADFSGFRNFTIETDIKLRQGNKFKSSFKVSNVIQTLLGNKSLVSGCQESWVKEFTSGNFVKKFKNALNVNKNALNAKCP